MFRPTARALRAAIGVSTLAIALATMPAIQAQNAPSTSLGAGTSISAPAPNYDLASAWMPAKVSRLVFDTSVTPRWLETSDRFWYAFNTREGRRFVLVDPVKKTKAPLFDHAKMAAALTSLTGIPYDAQHLPFTQVRFTKNDTAFEFEYQVPRETVIRSTKPKPITTEQGGGGGKGADELSPDRTTELPNDRTAEPQQGQRGQGGQRGGGEAAGRGATPPRNKTLHFEYDMASGRVTYLEDYPEEPRRPTWALHSPDGKTILFARNHNLFMMDAANYEKAIKNANDKTIVEHQLTDDGIEHYSFGGGGRGGGGQQQQQQQQQQQD
jgi:dipeptidyl-peptidase-4